MDWIHPWIGLDWVGLSWSFIVASDKETDSTDIDLT